MHFADEVLQSSREKKSLLCVGLDPDPQRLPMIFKDYCHDLEGMAQAVLDFNQLVIEAVSSHAVAVKPQLAYYELLGPKGLLVLQKTAEIACSKGLFVILDGKRNDIGSTARAYAKAYLGVVEDSHGRENHLYQAHALTINPYFGADGLLPFFEEAKRWGKGVFILVKTSNPSSAEIQDKELKRGGTIAHYLAEKVSSWGEETIGREGYSLLGAVVGATAGPILTQLRGLMPKALFLVPGIGAQGGKMDDLKGALDEEGLGALVNVSRDILFASKEDDTKNMIQQKIEERACYYREGLWSLKEGL